MGSVDTRQALHQLATSLPVPKCNSLTQEIVFRNGLRITASLVANPFIIKCATMTLEFICAKMELCRVICF